MDQITSTVSFLNNSQRRWIFTLNVAANFIQSNIANGEHCYSIVGFQSLTNNEHSCPEFEILTNDQGELIRSLRKLLSG